MLNCQFPFLWPVVIAHTQSPQLSVLAPLWACSLCFTQLNASKVWNLRVSVKDTLLSLLNSEQRNTGIRQVAVYKPHFSVNVAVGNPQAWSLKLSQCSLTHISTGLPQSITSPQNMLLKGADWKTTGFPKQMHNWFHLPKVSRQSFLHSGEERFIRVQETGNVALMHSSICKHGDHKDSSILTSAQGTQPLEKIIIHHDKRNRFDQDVTGDICPPIHVIEIN